MSESEKIVEWDGQTHHHIERSTDWFWAVGLIAIAAAGIAAWFGDSIFSAVILIGAFAMGLAASREPRILPVHIDEHGIHIDHDHYQWKTIRSFWIRTEFMPSPRLHLHTSHLLHPDLALTIPDEELAEQVRSALLQHKVTEEEHHTGGSMLADLLGF